MPGLSRAYFFVGALLILAIFYFSSSLHTTPTNSGDERLAIWVDAGIPDHPQLTHDFKEAFVDRAHQEHSPGVGNINFNPFPLGKDREENTRAFKGVHKTAVAQKPLETVAVEDSNTKATDTAKGENGGFNEMVFEFQKDLKYPQPSFDIPKLKAYKPKNFKGRGSHAFATYLSSRNPSIHDPYFQAAQQLAYRILWDPKSRSARYPFIVFVAPFISKEQRDLLAAAGAIVKELELVPWNPTVNIWARWRDLFSKINMWGETDFDKIAFLDSDAFPVQNIDEIFDLAPEQHCIESQLPSEDRPHVNEICDYVFTGTEVANFKEINVGVMVFKPNRRMQQRLLRESKHTDKFDNKMAEQAFLNMAFSVRGPFPMTFIGREYNGFYPQPNEEGFLKIVHEKLWAFGELVPWTASLFKNAWNEMVELYESPAFETMRASSGEL